MSPNYLEKRSLGVAFQQSKLSIERQSWARSQERRKQLQS